MVIKTEVIIDVDEKSRSVNRKHKGFSLNTIMTSIQMTESKKLIVCCLGIFVCYFYYGILQEKITRTTYGADEEKFTYQQTLVCMQCIVNALFAYFVIKSTHSGAKDETPTLMYLWCSISYMGAMLASNMALRYVNYPTQVLGKSCKPIPVMILGVLLARKRYPLMKYICVLFIVLGVALFFYKDKKGAAQKESTGYGELLLLLSLTLDGMTGASQDKMRGQHKTQAHSMMYAVNKFSILLLGAMVLISGEIFHFIAFVTRYPYVLWNMFLFGLTSALGQNFIFLTVANYGPLTCSVVTTTRKFFTILFSILFFGNAITTRQSFAVLLVFIGLGLDAKYGKTR